MDEIVLCLVHGAPSPFYEFPIYLFFWQIFWSKKKMILKVVWRVLMGVLRVLEGCCRAFEVCLEGVWKKKIEVWNQSDPPRLRNYFTKKKFTNDPFPNLSIFRETPTIHPFQEELVSLTFFPKEPSSEKTKGKRRRKWRIAKVIELVKVKATLPYPIPLVFIAYSITTCCLSKISKKKVVQLMWIW